MLRVHEWLMANRYPNCRKIAEEFEVSAKTVQRDVNFMRDQLGLPIEYEKVRFGFYYSRPVPGFPSIGGPSAKDAAPPAKPRLNPWRRSQPPPLGDKQSLATGGRPRGPVRIGFDTESARVVRSRTWHPSQILLALPDGTVEMTVQPRDDWELACWILSWGGHAWVIDPPRLRTQLRELARTILARH
jgi:predicted DNA-binding transcriptional regulator YafY